MNEPEIGTYCDAVGSRHRLVVRRTAEGDWRVLDVDVTSGTAHIVDALTGEQDGRPQAEAIARDYLTTVDRLQFEAGPVAGEPIPEQGGSDARSHRRSHPAPRQQRARRVALPPAAR